MKKAIWYDDNNIRRSALIGGMVVPYDVCSEERDAYAKEEMSGFFRCIGYGTIESIDGVCQSGDTEYFFFRSQESDS